MAENKRKTISKKLRFEIFKRDNFTCQYCGKSAPDVVLEVDHINPVNNGGDNDIMNLITSCFDCNRGKGKRKLSDKSEIKMQMEQLKELNTKREQLEMLLKWKEELSNFENEQANKIENILFKKTGFNFSDYGKKDCIKQIKEFGFEEVYESTIISINQYYDETDENSVRKVFDYIGKICCTRRRQKDNPLEYKINYLCKIAKNNLYYFDNIKMRNYLKRNFELDDFENIKEIFKLARNWTELKRELESYYGEEV